MDLAEGKNSLNQLVQVFRVLSNGLRTRRRMRHVSHAGLGTLGVTGTADNAAPPPGVAGGPVPHMSDTVCFWQVPERLPKKCGDLLQD